MSNKKATSMSLRDSLALRTLHQIGGISIYRIIKESAKYPAFKKYSNATLYRHGKKSLNDDPVDERRHNPGRPSLMTARDKSAIKRQITILR